jgi:DNA replication protein DnaC
VAVTLQDVHGERGVEDSRLLVEIEDLQELEHDRVIARLGAAHHGGHLETELKKIRRYKLIIIDEVGYIPFDHDAANLFFQLVESRYEQGSIMVTSNLPFGRWDETFSDDVAAAAMIDRLVHHAEVLTLTGDS